MGTKYLWRANGTNNILVDAGLLPGPKVKTAHPKKKPAEEKSADAAPVAAAAPAEAPAETK